MTDYAKTLNDTLEHSVISSLLSAFGKRIYLPKGIIVQGGEAKGRRYNATIGIAVSHGEPMHLNSIRECFSPNLKNSELFPYAPSLGKPELREMWKTEMLYKNPTLKGKTTSLPCVTSGLTNALFTVASLFIDKNDEVILPDLYWENYNLVFTEYREAKLKTFPMFKKGGFNLDGFRKTLDKSKKDKIIVLLNFPNNPTGYTPTKREQIEIVKILKEKAESGKKLLVMLDDAYFSLFFEEDTAKESLFSYLADCHENLLAIKCDAATKEEMVWGFRLGFITFAHKGITKEEIDALSSKFAGSIRGSLSNCPQPSQSILLRAMESKTYHEDKKEGVKVIEERYNLLKNTLKKYKSNKNLVPLPFNSGYFMSFEVKNTTAETLRTRLLEKYDCGTIACSDNILRIAFSSIDKEDIEEVVKRLYEAATEE